MAQLIKDRISFLEAARERAEDKSADGDVDDALAEIDKAVEDLGPELSELEWGLVWRARAKIFGDHWRPHEAIDASERSAAYYNKLNDQFEAAKSQVSQVQYLGEVERVEDAVQLSKEIESAFVDFPLGLIILASNLGRAFLLNWRNEEALAALKKSRQLAVDGGFPYWAAYSQIDIALVYEQLGELQKAEEAHTLTLSELEATDDVWSMMKVAYNRASVLLKLGKYELALSSLEKARSGIGDSQESNDLGYILQFEGRCRMAIGEINLAIELLKKAASIFETYDSEIEFAETAVLLGKLFAQTEDPTIYQSGLEYLKRALEKIHGDEYKPLRADALLGNADLLFKFNRLDLAVEMGSRAKAIFDELDMSIQSCVANLLIAEIEVAQGGALNSTQQRLVENLPLIDLLPRQTAIKTLHLLGQVYQHKGAYVESKKYLEQALAGAEAYRNQLSRHEHQAWVGQFAADIGHDFLSVLHQMPASDEKNLNILEIIEKLRAGGLSQLIGETRQETRSRESIPQDLLEQRQTLRRQLTQLEQAEQNQQLTPNARLLQAEQQRRTRFDLTHALKRVDESISRSIRAEVNGETPLEPTEIDLDNIWQLGVNGDVAIHYYTIAGELWGLIIDFENQKIQRLSLNINVDTILGYWKQAARYLQPKHAARGVHKRLRQRLEQLYGALITPLAGIFEGENLPERLILIPAVELWEIPFSGLVSSESGKYLFEQTTLIVTSSLQTLTFSANENGILTSGLAVGYGGTPEDRDYLPAVKQEIEALYEVWGEKMALITDEAAQGETIFARLQTAGPPDIFHVAAHIEYEPDDPMASGIRLAQNERLSAADLYVRPGLLKDSLVVLSGCDSGRVKPTGTELLGLNSGILFAGARGIVSSLWPVSDEATRAFMTAFYSKLQSKPHDPARALKLAIEKMKGDPHFESPYYWAPFYYSGR